MRATHPLAAELPQKLTVQKYSRMIAIAAWQHTLAEELRRTVTPSTETFKRLIQLLFPSFLKGQ